LSEVKSPTRVLTAAMLSKDVPLSPSTSGLSRNAPFSYTGLQDRYAAFGSMTYLSFISLHPNAPVLILASPSSSH